MITFYCELRYNSVFHVTTYTEQYKRKFIPTSANALKVSPLWPPPMKSRPGRKKRRRYEAKEPKKETNSELPDFKGSPSSASSTKKAKRTCSLCGKQGHYASTCRKPDSSKIVKKSTQYRKFLEHKKEQKEKEEKQEKGEKQEKQEKEEKEEKEEEEENKGKEEENTGN